MTAASVRERLIQTVARRLREIGGASYYVEADDGMALIGVGRLAAAVVDALGIEQVAMDDLAETIEAWVDCEHLSFDGTGLPNEWRCMGCGRVHLETGDDEQVLLDPDPEWCARNVIGVHGRLFRLRALEGSSVVPPVETGETK